MRKNSENILTTFAKGRQLGSLKPQQKKKWEAYIQFKGHTYHLGLNDTIDAAAEARRNAEEKYFTPLLEKHKNKLRLLLRGIGAYFLHWPYKKRFPPNGENPLMSEMRLNLCIVAVWLTHVLK